MPLDTRDKRASAIHVGLPFGRILPFRDGVVDQGDRQHTAYLYRGIQSYGVPPTLDLDAGSYAVTGTPLDVLVGYSLPASPSAPTPTGYLITGSAITLQHGYHVAASSGTYGVSGTALTLTEAARLTANGSSYALTGSAVTIAVLSAQTYIALTDQLGGLWYLSIGGDPVELILSNTVPGGTNQDPANAYSWFQWQSPDLTTWYVYPDRLGDGTAELAITSTVPPVGTGTTNLLTLTTGLNLPWSVSVSNIPEIVLTKVGALMIEIEAGTYLLTGSPTVIQTTTIMTLESGLLSVTGTALQITRSPSTSLEAGTYTLTGAAVTLLQHHTLSAESGSLTQTGMDLLLTHVVPGMFTLDAESGSFTLTGSALTLTRAAELVAELGSLLLTGSDVDLLVTVVVLPPVQVTIDLDTGTYAVSGMEMQLTVGLAHLYVPAGPPHSPLSFTGVVDPMSLGSYVGVAEVDEGLVYGGVA